MDMTVFQIESNKVLPKQGSILISAPYLRDWRFERSVILLVDYCEEGCIGIMLNKKIPNEPILNTLIPELEHLPPIPLFEGGPISRETIFFLHDLGHLSGSFPLGDGLYLNGDFEQMKDFLLENENAMKHVRFFSGYAGWKPNQLLQEIEENTWFVSYRIPSLLLNPKQDDLWKSSMADLGGKYELYSRYPLYPCMN